jgi:hypothetical protein
LTQFYAQKGNMDAILPYINGNAPLSLRLIDWFVTNYVKRHTTIIEHDGGKFINVCISYLTQLKAYSKQQFDPFRRRDRIPFHYDADKVVETTVGQLNFFRWMLQNRVLQYVQENALEIERAMIEHEFVAGGGSRSKKRNAETVAAPTTAPAATEAEENAGGGSGSPTGGCASSSHTSMVSVRGRHTISFE